MDASDPPTPGLGRQRPLASPRPDRFPSAPQPLKTRSSEARVRARREAHSGLVRFSSPATVHRPPHSHLRAALKQDNGALGAGQHFDVPMRTVAGRGRSDEPAHLRRRPTRAAVAPGHVVIGHDGVAIRSWAPLRDHRALFLSRHPRTRLTDLPHDDRCRPPRKVSGIVGDPGVSGRSCPGSTRRPSRRGRRPRGLHRCR
jgi:hypothetical protein